MDADNPGNSVSPPGSLDPVIELYKRDVDRTLIRENLKLSVEDRIRKLESMMQFVEAARNAMKIAKGRQ
jgi:hypothetical protein